MKKLFAIIAAFVAAMAMAITLASCGGDTGTGYACLDEPIVKKAPTPTTDPEPEPEPDPDPVEPTDTTTVVIPGFKGAVVGGEFKKVTNEYWPSVKFVENDEGTQSHGGNLRPLAIWERSFNNKIFTLNDTETEETRFLRVEKTELNDYGFEIDTDTLRVGFLAGEPDAILTNGIGIPFKVERRYGWVVVGGKYEPLDNGLNKYEYIVNADVIGEDTVFMGNEVYLREEVELTLKMKVTNASFTDEDVITIFIDKKVEVAPEEVEVPATEPDPDPVQAEPEPTPEPEPEPEPDPEPEPEPEMNPNFEIKNLQSFIAWTVVMDGNDNFHDCIFFDCGDRWAALIDQKTVLYFVKSCVRGSDYNSLNWDNVDNIWVPALASGSSVWNYSTVLSDGNYIDRSCDANQACIQANKNFTKNDAATTSWKVNANATSSEYKGKTVITVTSHRVVIDKDYKIVFMAE